jgi:outer membrane protein assembly factor BamA
MEGSCDVRQVDVKIRWFLVAGLAAALLPWPAMARELAPDLETMETVERGGWVAHDLEVVVVPIPRSDPTLGTGLALPALFLYNPEGKGRPWMTGVGAMYTDSNSWATGIFQKAYLLDDRLRLTGALGYGDLNLDFYGVGANAGKQGVSVPISQRGSFLFLEGLGQIAPSTFLGVRYRRINLETGFRNAPVPGLGITIPATQLNNTSAAMGPVLQFDTRDSEQYPTKGTFVDFNWVFARDALGSDSDYDKGQVAANHYMSLSSSSVLALRASMCSAGGQVPFYDLCLFGSNNDLRGYVGGQYRDKAMFALQAEYRWRFAERWGLVAFGGAGSVAKSLGNFRDSDLLPAVGTGLRFLASKKHGVNVSMDYAIGRDTKTFYFYIGEAF